MNSVAILPLGEISCISLYPTHAHGEAIIVRRLLLLLYIIYRELYSVPVSARTIHTFYQWVDRPTVFKLLMFSLNLLVRKNK